MDLTTFDPDDIVYLPKAITRDCGFKAAAVWGVIDYYANDPCAIPTQDELAAQLGMGQNTLRKYLQVLAENCYARTFAIAGNNTWYFLCCPGEYHG